ncbi:MAG: hypothetical protein ACREU6_15310 [Steroidobacteraceae bacterium]
MNYGNLRRFLLASAGSALMLLAANSAGATGAPPAAPPSLCANGKCVATSTGTIKWHPGHYLSATDRAFYGTAASGRMLQSSLAKSIDNESAIQGIQQMYTWAALEPQKGQYDFSQITSDLKYLHSLPTPKRLIINLVGQEYGGLIANGANAVSYFPQYLVDEGRVVDFDYGFVATVWDPATMDRMVALIQALGAAFDSDPLVEAFVYEGETSLGFSKGTPSGYSIGGFIAQYQRWITAARAAFPTTNVAAMTNWLPPGGTETLLGQIIATAAQVKAGFGQPDIEPTVQGDWGQDYTIGANGMPSYKGKVPLVYQVQYPGAVHFGTASQIFSYGVDTLGATHIIWQYTAPGEGFTTDWTWGTGVLPLIRQQNGRTVTACPTLLAGSCNTGG